MKVIIAPDSFKESLSAKEAAEAIHRGVKKALPSARTILIPVADGGEGTMESLVAATNGQLVNVLVTGPLHSPVQAAYGVLGDRKTCVIEMVAASGLCLVNENERNPMKTTTLGTGELIKRALDDGFRTFILAIGGSATNDGGIGMLQALGMKLVDSNGNPVGYGGEVLAHIAEIDSSSFDPRIQESKFLIATDVQNPFVGKNGATHVFGPQKGATPEMIEVLENHMVHWANVIEQYTGIRLHHLPGAGAAGGIGGAFQAFFPSRMKRGVDVVIEYVNFHEHLEYAACVFTGEGQIDFQTASGKTPLGIAQAANKKGVPVFVLTGSIGQGIEHLYNDGITSIHSIINKPMSLREAIENVSDLLEETAEQVMRTFLATSKSI